MRYMLAAAALLFAAGCQTVPDRAPDFTPAQVVILKENGFAPVDGNWELRIEDQLLFDSDMSTLAPGRQAVVDRLVRALLAAGVRGGLLEGHTDSVGSVGYNAGLSRARAEAVKAAMVTSGMADANVRLVALGEAYPVQTNRTPTGRRENRRVVLIVTPRDAK